PSPSADHRALHSFPTRRSSDLARVGQLLVQGGARGSTPIVPERWIDDIAHHGDPAAWAAGNGSEFFPGLPLRYRSKWYVQDGAADRKSTRLNSSHVSISYAVFC